MAIWIGTSQPKAFRSYDGCSLIKLPLTQSDPKGSYINLYQRNHKLVTPLTIESIAKLLELSMGLSAWKSISNDRWPLRMNPSSGNLHPTEAYLLIPEMNGLSAGVYHYNPYHHALEKRSDMPNEIMACNR